MGIMTNGVKQWIFQRVSNAVFVIFGLVLLFTILSNGLTYDSLVGLFSNGLFKAFAFIALVLACLNAILAGWQIAGDYAEKFNIPFKFMMAVAIIVSIAYLIYGFMILFCS